MKILSILLVAIHINVIPVRSASVLTDTLVGINYETAISAGVGIGVMSVLRWAVMNPYQIWSFFDAVLCCRPCRRSRGTSLSKEERDDLQRSVFTTPVLKNMNGLPSRIIGDGIAEMLMINSGKGEAMRVQVGGSPRGYAGCFGVKEQTHFVAVFQAPGVLTPENMDNYWSFGGTIPGTRTIPPTLYPLLKDVIREEVTKYLPHHERFSDDPDGHADNLLQTAAIRVQRQGLFFPKDELDGIKAGTLSLHFVSNFRNPHAVLEVRSLRLAAHVMEGMDIMYHPTRPSEATLELKVQDRRTIYRRPTAATRELEMTRGMV